MPKKIRQPLDCLRGGGFIGFLAPVQQKTHRRTLIDFAQLNNYTSTDVKFASFVFGIGCPANITATALQFGAKLLLG